MARTQGLNKPCILIIVIAGMERFAFKGVASNLVTYLTDVMKMSNSSAAKTVNSWCGFTSLLSLLMAPLADSYWDQYSTILFSSFLYALGLLALTSTTFPINKTSSTSSLLWSLYMISIGQGGYNPSLQVLGADQLENEDETLPSSINEKNSDKGLFFGWSYFGICSGSLLGATVMSYIQDNLGWGLGFAIPAIIMVTSISFFSCGSKLFTYKQANKGGDVKSLKNIVHAIKGTAVKMMNVQLTMSNKSDVVELEFEEEKPLCHQDLDGSEGVDKSSNTGIHLPEIAKVILHLLPTWTTLLMFAVIFQKPMTFFTKQGVTMQRNIGSNFKIPPAMLQSVITVSIILLTPLYNMYFIPLARVVTHNEKGISVMQRMGIGMLLSVIAMVIAALVETKRLKISKNTQSETVPLSIFWLLPQYILLGISDIFTVIGMQEFFYSEVPIRMRTTGIALYTSVFGVGNFLSALLITILDYFTNSRGGGRQSWSSDDMRESRLDKYYWLLALGSSLSMLTFVILGRFYKSRI
ncbi:hypothetical protein CsSME_00005089 [Camellia sinensis var. sinensis]